MVKLIEEIIKDDQHLKHLISICEGINKYLNTLVHISSLNYLYMNHNISVYES